MRDRRSSRRSAIGGRDAVVVFTEGLRSATRRPARRRRDTPLQPRASPSRERRCRRRRTGVDLVAVVAPDGARGLADPPRAAEPSRRDRRGDAGLRRGATTGPSRASTPRRGRSDGPSPPATSIYRPVTRRRPVRRVGAPGDAGGVLRRGRARTHRRRQAWRVRAGWCGRDRRVDAPAVAGRRRSFVGVRRIATVRAFDLATGSTVRKAGPSQRPRREPHRRVGEPRTTSSASSTSAGRSTPRRRDRASGRWDLALNAGALRPEPRRSRRGPRARGDDRGELFALELETGDLVWSADWPTAPLRALAVTE